MNSQEILKKYKNQEIIKNMNLDEIITLVKDESINELSPLQLQNTKLDKYEIVDINLSEQIFKNEELHKKLFKLNIKLTLNDDLIQELLQKNAMYMQAFSSKIQIKYKDFILNNSCLGFRYLCEKLKYDFDFLKQYIKAEKERLISTNEHYKKSSKINNHFNSVLKNFKANQNYNEKLLECFTSNSIEIYAYNKERFKLKQNLSLKDILSDTQKYKKIILNKNEELKKTYYELVLSEFSSLSDDEFKDFLTKYIVKASSIQKLFKQSFNFLKRTMQINIADTVINYFKNNELFLELSNEQAQELVSLKTQVKEIIKDYKESKKKEKIIISFLNDTTKSLIVEEDKIKIDELINLAYTKELKEEILHSDLINKENLSNLIIDDMKNTATLIRYESANSATKKLTYSFKKEII
ncbi:hypothetical protein AVCANL277_06520 [Campylobacter canadensis]|uniref:hypothetical protein n=1 Tax=Campylobacter canadensis TaxID=449520 RepID=UPI001554D0FE|nr:hypothetical protein [Campylobacter canadensis]MBZ8000514.1 hypothetical protein [Campylobacter canadensis]